MWVLVVILLGLVIGGYFLFHPLDDQILAAYAAGRPTWNLFFATITMFGDELLNIVFILLVYYCGDKKLGTRLAYVVVVANFLDVALKGVFGIPRPNPPASQVPDLLGQTYTDYSFPSGHSVNAGAFWGFLALEMGHPVMWVVAAVMIVLVPMSRNYLGVHWPSDAFVGACLGILLAVVAWWAAPRLEEKFKSVEAKTKLVLAILGPVVAFALAIGAILLAGNDLARADPSSAAALLVGITVGAQLEREHVGFAAAGKRGNAKILAYRAVLGIVLVMGTYFGLKTLFGESASLMGDVTLRFVRYLLLAFVGILLVPWLFTKIERAAPEKG